MFLHKILQKPEKFVKWDFKAESKKFLLKNQIQSIIINMLYPKKQEREKTMRKWKTAAFLMFLVFLLAGCGKTKAEMTTIAIQKDGSIEHTVIEGFGDSSIDALRNIVLEKTAAYNNKNLNGKDGIAVNSVEASDGTVKVVMTYPDAEAFDGFMNMDVETVDPALRAPFFYGTVEDALMEGFDLDINMQSVKNEEDALQGKSDILTKGDNKIIIYDSAMNLGAPMQIGMPEKPLYVSENVTVVEKKLVEISETDGLAYIMLGK